MKWLCFKFFFSHRQANKGSSAASMVLHHALRCVAVLSSVGSDVSQTHQEGKRECPEWLPVYHPFMIEFVPGEGMAGCGCLVLRVGCVWVCVPACVLWLCCNDTCREESYQEYHRSLIETVSLRPASGVGKVEQDMSVLERKIQQHRSGRYS